MADMRPTARPFRIPCALLALGALAASAACRESTSPQGGPITELPRPLGAVEEIVVAEAGAEATVEAVVEDLEAGVLLDAIVDEGIVEGELTGSDGDELHEAIAEAVEEQVVEDLAAGRAATAAGDEDRSPLD